MQNSITLPKWSHQAEHFGNQNKNPIQPFLSKSAIQLDSFHLCSCYGGTPKVTYLPLVCCSTKTSHSFDLHGCYGTSQSHLPSSLSVVVQRSRQLSPSQLLWYLPKSPTFLLVCCSTSTKTSHRQLSPSQLLWYLPKSPTFFFVCCRAVLPQLLTTSQLL